MYSTHKEGKSVIAERFIRILKKKRTANTNQKEFRIEKVIKTKQNKLYVEQKGYDNSLTVGFIKMM